MAERRENIEELRRTVARLEKIKPDANNRYTLGGKVYTKTAWEEYVKTFKDRLDRLEGASQIRGENARQTNQNAIDAEILAANKKRIEINEYLTDFVQAFNKARTVEDEDALRIWRDYYQKEVDKLNKYVDDLTARRVQVGAVDLDLPFQKYEPDQVTPSTAQPRSGTVVATPVTATGNTTDISNITNKNQAKTEIARLRERATNLQNLIGEKQSGGNILYFEAPGMVGMSKGQRDAIIAGIEARIAALNTKFFAETPAAGQAATAPAGTPTGAGTSTTGAPLAAGAATLGGVAPTPGVAYGGMGVAPATTTTPAGEPALDLSGVRFTEPTPAGGQPPATTATTSTTAATTAAGTTAIPAAAAPNQAYTDPATRATYQPGQQIGGEDRVLPNGGAVVDGIYIPPGIDYAAIGAAMQVPANWEKAAREMFGVWYDVFKNDPEMSAFLQRLMREPEMSDAMFQAELQKTNWWRTTNATARDFARRQVEDPATLNSEIMDRTSVLRQAALDRGLAVDDRSLNDAALKMVQFGFSQQTALNHLAQLTLGTATGPSSLVQGFFGQSVRELAANYGVPLSDATLMKWTGDIATGNQSLNSFEAYARDLAKNLYPSLSNGYDRGLSFTQMTSPYAQVASRILDIPDSQIDFTDPKWAAAFTKRDEKGGQVQMTYGEWADYLRTTPSFGYEYTDEAISKAYNVVNDLAELFGRA